MGFINPHGKEAIISDCSWRTSARESSCRRRKRLKCPQGGIGNFADYCISKALKGSTEWQQNVKDLETSQKWPKDPWGVGGEGLKLGSSREERGRPMPPSVTGKETQHCAIFTVRAGQGCHGAVLALCQVKASAGAGRAASTLAWPAMHFCVVPLRAISAQLLIQGLLWGHLKAGSAPAFKGAYFVSWLVSGSGRIGCCRIGSAWE